MGQVQERARLVQQKGRRGLGQHERHPDTLPLTTGEFVDPAMGETRGIGECQGLGDGGVVAI